MAEKISLELEILLSKYSSNIRGALRDAQKLEKAFNSLQASAAKVEKALNGINTDVKVKVDVDSGSVNRAKSNIKGLNTSSKVTVDVTADTTKAESDIKSVDDNAPKVEIPVTADVSGAESDIKGIDSVAPDVDIPVTADISDAEGKLDDIEGQLKTIKNLAFIELGFNIAGGVLDTAKNLPIVGQALELESAAKSITGSTRSISESGSIIRSIYSSNFGDSYGEIAGAIQQIDQVTGSALSSSELEDAALSAFQAAQVTGEDVNEIIKTQSMLMTNGLVPSYRDAADLITYGFQNGANRSDDFLDTLYEYAPNFRKMGMDGASAVDLIVQSMQAGTFNTDKLGDAIKESGVLLDEALGDGAGKAYDALVKLDEAGVNFSVGDQILTATELAGLQSAGEIGAAEFADALIGGLNTAVSEGQISDAFASFNLIEIFGTPLEDLGVDIFRNLNFEGSEMEGLENAAENSANAVNDTLASSFEELQKTVADLLLPDMETLQGIIDDITDKVQELTGLLKDGVSLPEALAITLDMPGLADTLRGIESVMGNLLIGFLEILAGVQDLTGGDSSGTRSEITRLAGNQLAFDLAVSDDVSGFTRAIETAAARGVGDAAIGEALTGAVKTALERGDLGLAQALIDEAQNVNPVELIVKARDAGGDYEAFTIPVNVDKNATEEEMKEAARIAREAFLEETGKTAMRAMVSDDIVISPDVATEAAQALVDDFRTEVQAATRDKLTELGAFEEVETGVSDMRETVDDETTKAAESVSDMESEAGSSLLDLQRKLIDGNTDWTTYSTGATEEIDKVEQSFAQMVFNVDQQAQVLSDILNDVSSKASGAVPGSSFKGTPGGGGKGIKVNAEGGFNPANIPFMYNPGEELAFFGSDVSVLNNQTSQALMQAVQALGVGGGPTYNVNVNQYFNNSTDARSRSNANIASNIMNGIG